MNGRLSRVKCSRSGRQPDPQQRSVGLAPPPSLLHDSPVSSMEGRGQCDSPSNHHPPFILLSALPQDTEFSSPHQTFLSSNPGNSRTRWSNMCSPFSAPLGEVEASPRVPRHHSRPAHPLATRAHRLPGPPAYGSPARAPHPSPWVTAREGEREGDKKRLPRGSLLHLIPGQLAAHPACGSRRPLGTGPAPCYPENTIPTHLAQAPDHPSPL